MTAPRSFLMALAQALSYRRLYGSGHPVSRAAVATAVDRADFLLSEAEQPVFEFDEGEVRCAGHPVRDPGPVGWANRLSRAGVHRIDVREVPDTEEMNRFLEALETMLEAAVQAPPDRAPGGGETLVLPATEPGVPEAPLAAASGPAAPAATTTAPAPTTTAPVGPPEVPAVSEAPAPYGLVPTPAVADAPPGGEEAPSGGQEEPGLMDLGPELACVSWIWDEVEGGRGLPVVEAESVVHSLGALLRELPPRTAPRVRDPRGWEYGPLHALHTALLAMAWVRDAGASPREVVDFGLAGLFHDVGLVVSAPGGRLDHAGRLDEEERALVEAHPVEGARLLLASDARLSLAAVVAFEHHLLPGGGGYPAASLVGEPHPAARVIQVLSSYDALRLSRPHRLARSAEATREVVRSGAGRIFDTAFVQGFERIDPEWPVVASRPLSSVREERRDSA